ncbi:MAG: Serine/threonine-protein kinase BtrW [Smithella sp. PtaU1.Bin162]|nr:MAG: Serine/threonine-protein kinase BtrW [Smithella sp. PtaU1.Bin162]
MPGRMESLHDLLAFISGNAARKGLSPAILSRIELVAEEALVNVFMHAYNQFEGNVEVHCPLRDDHSFTFEIRDEGISFDPLSLTEPDRNMPLDERRIGGMGVFLIRKMADQVQYRREGNSNILTLTFFNR